MNTLKFRNIAIPVAEQHNLELINTKEINIFNKNLKISEPCNLNIFITSLCNNNCSFCINKDYSGTDIDDNKYYKALEKVLDELTDKDVEITITGGEPTLKIDRFIKTMQMCRDRKLKCRTVSTTGIGLIELYKNREVCQHMIENKFIHNINISRMHYDENKNNKIFKGKVLTNKEIEKLAYFFDLNNADMRLSCNIINNYIDSFDKVLKYVEFYDELGVKDVIFREIIGENNIKMADIMKQSHDIEFIENLEGETYKVKVYKYKNKLVKHYITKNKLDNKIINSLSLRNGRLRVGFGGETVWEL